MMPSQPTGFPSAPPALEGEHAHAEECRRFLLANVTALSLHLSIRSCLESGNHPSSNPLNECFLLQTGQSGTLFSKQVNKRVRHTIAHGLDALVKANKFLLNLK